MALWAHVLLVSCRFAVGWVLLTHGSDLWDQVTLRSSAIVGPTILVNLERINQYTKGANART